MSPIARFAPGCRRKSGIALVYTAISLVAMFSFCSLAVDLARVRLAKSELQQATDTAARYGATGLATSPATARARAKASAAENTVDGSAPILADSDIQLGTWSSSTRTFTVLSAAAESGANALRINATRTSAKGNAVPLPFEGLIGVSSCNVSASGTTLYSAGAIRGFIGLNGVTVKNNTFIASYNSGTSTSPSQGTAYSNAALSSNGVIYGKNNNDLKGSLILGPSGSASGFAITGSTTTQTAAISKPSSPTWSPVTNPGGISQTYTVNSPTTLAGGIYYFTSLTVNSTLQFSGPTTLYVNGNIDLNAGLKPTSLIPSDLVIYQIGSYNFGDSGSNSMDIVAVISAPDSDFVSKNNFTFRGSGTFDTITVKNNADFFYDEALGNATGSAAVSTVK